MGHLPIPRRRLALLAAFAAALGGCVVVPAHRAYGGYRSEPVYSGDRDDYVAVAPPPVQYEVVGVAPHPGWFWIGGNWSWRANRYVWVGGRWQAPRHGYRWQPHRWEPMSPGRGWRERHGGWQH
jgi:WXXGXW repeat (2 copies)